MTAMSKPLIFMMPVTKTILKICGPNLGHPLRYLLRHQTDTPTKTIASGSMNWLKMRILFMLARS